MPYLNEPSLSPDVGTTVPHLQLIKNKGSEGSHKLPKDTQPVHGSASIQSWLAPKSVLLNTSCILVVHSNTFVDPLSVD